MSGGSDCPVRARRRLRGRGGLGFSREKQLFARKGILASPLMRLREPRSYFSSSKRTSSSAICPSASNLKIFCGLLLIKYSSTLFSFFGHKRFFLVLSYHLQDNVVNRGSKSRYL